MKPVIAIPQMGGGLFHGYMKNKYVQSLKRAGAEVRWISLTDMDSCISQMLACDGLLLPGGADIDPALYGQEPVEACGKPDRLRDAAEMKMLEAFLKTNKPVLCVCRGMQMLNVYAGGTLYQDIRKIQTCNHRRFRSRTRGCHRVRCFPHTRLGHLLGSDWLTVNSIHHQAVEQPGLGLTISAISEDGFIEAMEIIHHPFCIGVQWHPEHMTRDPQQQKLFSAFVGACKK